jgi:hypothetical protein
VGDPLSYHSQPIPARFPLSLLIREGAVCGGSGALLWLAYLSADSVAIFTLGHILVQPEPQHQLVSFCAPFLLVHLGGQDATITALSKQDNELWLRHLLSLVTQVAIAGYVVAKVSWQDHRLTAAMLLISLNWVAHYLSRVRPLSRCLSSSPYDPSRC